MKLAIACRNDLDVSLHDIMANGATLHQAWFDPDWLAGWLTVAEYTTESSGSGVKGILYCGGIAGTDAVSFV